MVFGVALATHAESWQHAKRAEELGYTSASFFDSPPLNADLFVAMGAAALATESIKLTTGVLIPSNRIAPVTASALGLRPVKLADMREYIRVVRALLACETVEWIHEGAPHKICLLNPDTGAINTKDPIPLYISATGPKSRALVAELGAGWICPLNRAASTVDALDDMRKKCGAAGRDLRDLRILGLIGGSVLREGETYDAPRVKDEAGPMAILVVHYPIGRKLSSCSTARIES